MDDEAQSLNQDQVIALLVEALSIEVVKDHDDDGRRYVSSIQLKVYDTVVSEVYL